MDAICWLRLELARIMHSFMVSEAGMSNLAQFVFSLTGMLLKCMLSNHSRCIVLWQVNILNQSQTIKRTQPHPIMDWSSNIKATIHVIKATTSGTSGLSAPSNVMLFAFALNHHKPMVLYQGGPLCLSLQRGPPWNRTMGLLWFNANAYGNETALHLREVICLIYQMWWSATFIYDE